MTAIEDAEIAASTALRDIGRAILGTVPVTVAGLTAKARWATADGVPPVFAPEWAQRVAADVIAERGGVAS